MADVKSCVGNPVPSTDVARGLEALYFVAHMDMPLYRFALREKLTPDERSVLALCVSVYRDNQILASELKYIAFREEWALETMR